MTSGRRAVGANRRRIEIARELGIHVEHQLVLPDARQLSESSGTAEFYAALWIAAWLVAGGAGHAALRWAVDHHWL
jgi:hypothetical protein